MQTLSEAKIAELLGVSLYIERPHESIQGMTVGEVGGPGWELVQLLKTTLDETGQVLVNGGYPNLGSFVAEALKEGARVAHEKVDPAVAADIVLERVSVASIGSIHLLIRVHFFKLVRAIPGFQDMSIVNDQRAYLYPFLGPISPLTLTSIACPPPSPL